LQAQALSPFRSFDCPGGARSDSLKVVDRVRAQDLFDLVQLGRLDETVPFPLEDPHCVRRIDPASVREEVEAAGFVLEAESSMLANKDDPHSI